MNRRRTYRNNGSSQSLNTDLYIHTEYGDEEAVYDFDGNLIEGNLPKKKERLVQAWINIHEEELAANWKLLSEGEQFFKISPLQ